MNLLKRIVSYSPYLLILFMVPVLAGAQDVSAAIHGGIKTVLWTFVNNIFGTLIAWAGITLDYAVNQYVIGFGGQWRNGVGGAIDMSWSIVRDVFNITFIFGLIWLGFKMILNSGDSSTRRTLITLIMAALLVNFSLFITKFVVDFTNILSTEIAQSFAAPPEGGEANPIGDASSGQAEISQAFMQLFGLTTLWESPEGAPGARDDMSGVSYMYIFGTAIVFLIGAFTFAAGAIMLIIRFAALCIFMVFSPLMFLGWVFPGMQSVSNKYWSGFLGRAFYAPAYLMLVYLAAFVMGSYNSTASGFRAATSQTFFNGSEFAGTGSVSEIASSLGPFLLTCVFLIASVVVAGKMSADGANTAIKVGQNLRGRGQKLVTRGAGAATFGVGARAMRNTAGQASHAYVNSDLGKKLASRSTFGKAAFKTAQAGAKSSYDVRQVGDFGKSMNLGTGAKGGFKQKIESREKSEDQFAKDIAKNIDFDDPKVKLALRNKTNEVRANEVKEKEKLATEKTERMKKLEQLKDRLEQEKAAGVPEVDQAETIKEMNEVAATLNDTEKILFIRLADAEKQIQNAGQTAKGMMKYENELAYVTKLKQTEQFWKKFMTVPGMTGGAVYGTGAAQAAGAGLSAFGIGAGASVLTLSGAGAVGAAAGGFGALGNAASAKAGHKAIIKRIGENGVKGLKNEDKKKNAELFKSILDENSDKKEKSDDDKE